MKKSMSVLCGLTNIRASYILESEIPDAAAAVARIREASYEHSARGRWTRITSSGWFVAAVCALVAGGTLAGIIWAGHNAPGTVAPVGSSSNTTEALQTEAAPETEAVIPYTEGLEFTPVEGEAGYCAVSGMGTATDRVLRIPETSPDGLTVKYIGEYAFQGNTHITELILPDTVEKIWYYAFSECVNLKKVTVGEGFREVEAQAFSQCRSLSEINLTHQHSVITYAMHRTPWLEKQTEEFVIYNGHLIDYNGPGGDVVIPDGVVHIEGGAFYYNQTVTSITLPDTCEYIRETAFQGCTSLTHLTAPPSLTYLGSCAFYECSSLRSIKIPGVTSLSYRTFMGCTSLTHVDIPAVAYIFAEAFAGCTSLSSVTFWENLSNILDGTFRKTAFTELTLPASVKQLGKAALSYCPNLTRVETSAKRVEDNCFENCPELREIILQDGVKNIGSNIFQNCVKLERLTLPATVTEIGQVTDIPSDALVIEYAGTTEDWANIQMDEQTAAILLPHVQFSVSE